MCALAKHQYIILFILLQTSVVFFFSLHKRNINSKSQSDLSLTLCPSTAQKERGRLILLWTWPFGVQFHFNECPFEESGCHFTDNRSLYHSADAVVLHHRDVSLSPGLLPNISRPKGQYWVWFNLESPENTNNLYIMDNLINLTMTYRADSDIFVPYGWLDAHDGAQIFSIPVKTKLVAWVVSNWNPLYNRSKYYEVLKEYIDIDIYGNNHTTLSTEEQFHTISKYKFYLAFENSMGKDYITEKLWKNAFFSGTVPIIMGPPRKNYERFIPKDSFIHVEDFATVKELADYLLELDKDDQKYQAYFQWRNWLKPMEDYSWATYYCKLCKVLENAPSYRTISNLTEWFIEKP
ncbi:3-galactosyl-N-acetylglucosaminide 4-alpha-L-fucosyltransferase FUT3-like [Discoglossus pictus]